MIYFAITTNILYMRKVLLSIALLTTAIYTVAQQRTEAEAAAIAKTFMQENGYNFDITKSTAPAKIRAKKAGEITPYYIFNDTRKGGFVIVGGQEGMSDILAYSDEECFDINDIPPTAANWLEAYTQCAIIAADEPEKSKACKREAAKAFAKSNFSLRQNVTPLLGEIKYNQMEPYNRKCPTLTVMEGGNKKTGTAITGCTQTAMAMIMRYWKWPERPTGSKSYTLNYYYSGSTTKQMNLSVNFNTEAPYEWDKILPRYEGHNYTAEQADAIARVMYHCGLCNEAEYGLNLTNAQLRHQGLVDYFGYSSDLKIDSYIYYREKPNGDNEFRAMFAEEISSGRPILAGGSSQDYTAGHYYVIDGFDLNGLFHFNLGWNGSSNGYYEVAPVPQVPYGYDMYICKHIHPEGRLTPTSPERNIVIEAALGEFNEQSANINSTLKTLTGNSKYSESIICILTTDTEEEAENYLAGLSSVQGVLIDRIDTVTDRVSTSAIEPIYRERYNTDAPSNIDIDAMFTSESSMKVAVSSQFARSITNANYRYAFVYTEDNVNIDGKIYNDIARGRYPDNQGFENSIPASVEREKEYIFEQEIPLPETIGNLNNTTLIVLMIDTDNGSIVNANTLDLKQINTWRNKQKPSFFNEGKLLGSSSTISTYSFDEEKSHMAVPVRINNPLYEKIPVEISLEDIEIADNAYTQLGEEEDVIETTHLANAYGVDSTLMLYLKITDKYQSSESSAKLIMRYKGNKIAEQTVNFGFIKSVEGPNPYTVRIKGTLAEIVPATAADTITTITLGGRLSGPDIAFVRNNLKLDVLDMRQSHIVTGPGAYYSSYKTEDNIVGVRMFNETEIKKIYLPNDVTRIDNYAFYQSEKLSKVQIGENVTYIGSYAFSGCTSLERITIPASVKELGRNAFKGTPIVCVICEGETPAKLGSKIFEGADLANATLVVPNEAAIATYKAQKQWKDFGNIITYEQYLTAIAPVTEDIEVAVAEGKITVSTDTEVAIYTFAGKQVATGKAGEYTLPAGNYIVKAGNKAIKVRL